ncbi:hypothetical protein DEM26_18130 [Thioclava sp. NG1]|uniref:YdaU family protein n=1 Tax=Thioclava sp. NG1 TaxID=2182426 RepID=UPI000D622D26|nr:DUF1376 domain-containing protein [Thioclava sp. NG1]PWE48467.1 hypothetical protein DEM26_18130 [Thioclava sp. NG1]
MSQAPAMPIYWDAYLADTTHLSTEEHGAYLLLLAAMWRRNGVIPDDDQDNARITGLSRAKWRRVKERLAPLLTIRNGEITQKKLQKTMQNTLKIIQKNRENGAKGGRPRTSENSNLAKPSGSCSDNPNESMPEPEPNNASHCRARDPKSDQEITHRERLLDAIGADRSGCIGPNGTVLGTVAHMEHAKRWSEMGLSVDRQCAVIREVIQRKQDKDPFFVPRSFGYFDGPMQEAAQAASGQGRAGRSVEDAQTAFLRRVAGGNGG